MCSKTDELKAYAVNVTWVHRYIDEVVVVAKTKQEAETNALDFVQSTSLGGEGFEATDMTDVTDTEEGNDAIKDHVC